MARAQIHYGETLQVFAARTLNDAAQWVQIAALNNLAPPYVSALPGYRMAVYGDTLLIPGVTQDNTPTLTSAEDVLQRDIALSQKGLLTANEKGDFSLVAGRDNLGQALGVRVTTEPGELLYHLEYGCLAANLKGERADPVNALLAQSYVHRAVSEDDRVASIDAATSSLAGDSIRVDVQCTAITSHPLNVTTTL